MIVVRFKVKCKPDQVVHAKRAFETVVGPSRAMPGVVHFDVAQDISDPSVLIATEVFADRSALEQQESLAEVHTVIGLLPGLLAAEPEATLFHVASSEPWGA